ncbi:MAG: EVE domain-containing protein [Gemmatimonadaceae bacterium]
MATLRRLERAPEYHSATIKSSLIRVMAKSTDRRFWLLKSEPDCFSYDDLLAAPHQTTFWSGVRNYQARNFMRDDMKNGDGVLFYHSGADPAGIVGTAEVVGEGYPDFTAWDPSDEHYDPKSTKPKPVWYMVDVRAGKRLAEFLDLPGLRHVRELEQMELLRKGSRLSVQPVRAPEWEAVLRLGGLSPRLPSKRR